MASAHITLGYTVLGLVGFRLIWGVLGTRYARVSSFVRGPVTVARYLPSLRRQPEHYTGHNPAGAVAILALLLLGLAVGVSGWATYTFADGEAFEGVLLLAAVLGYWLWQLMHPAEGLARPEAVAGNHETGLGKGD